MNPKDNQQVELMVAPTLMTNSATTTANLNINGRGSYCSIVISLAAELNTNAGGPAISLLESDDTVVTNFATITADRSGEDLTAAKNLIYHVDLRGRKRYLRLSVTSGTTDTNDDITFSANATISALKQGPSAVADMVASTSDSVVVV